ncbi:J domain-containing protein [Vibrio sp. YMD68]|uniref:J domain-containing protein n=1 Tax=Vibrio sp. YMD68 TaxID=3042300 RepID=UPI00249B905F|nr:J domain-containing protein [Vibrio sp. YMD68]WGW01896.1 J domain-containing protein [Vibrio sp. YMD68]
MLILKWLLSLLLLLPSLCFGDPIADLTPRAESNDALAQFQLANLYANSASETDLEQAFYWYQQAASNNHTQAHFTLATYYLKGIGTEPDLTQAVFWLTKLSTTGNVDAQLALATIYEQTADQVENLDMAEIWYLVAQPNSELAVEGYSRVLEAKFNQRKAQQVSSLDQLDIAFEPQQTDVNHTSDQTPVINHHTNPTYILIVLIIVAASIITFLYNRRRRAKSDHATKATKATKAENDQKRRLIESNQAQALIIKQQKKQIETIYRQFKKLQQASPKNANDQKLNTACAMFGFTSTKLPDQKTIKVRYKQLSKLYHPDLRGTDDEMKRLNNALKIILTHIK